MKRRILCAFFAASVAACASNPDSSITDSGGHPLHQFEGTATVVYADGVEAVRLEQLHGGCIGVSLPSSGMAELKRSGPREMTIHGLLMQVPGDMETATVRVNGRIVGYRQCGNTYVFVRSEKDIEWK